ncbi:hypothetical protein EVAR_66487_1 [Eumeta japonica]|uniref:Uncharacterized protein n=1 Tax=Eumeta variegata TaxID=151549 RepID=A0A4C1ZVQ8_EUMVA|nr:hypothetical protein EVAR_66487_1 [Eumeta japonica]
MGVVESAGVHAQVEAGGHPLDRQEADSVRRPLQDRWNNTQHAVPWPTCCSTKVGQLDRCYFSSGEFEFRLSAQPSSPHSPSIIYPIPTQETGNALVPSSGVVEIRQQYFASENHCALAQSGVQTAARDRTPLCEFSGSRRR